jgi:hypothetical protein
MLNGAGIVRGAGTLGGAGVPRRDVGHHLRVAVGAVGAGELLRVPRYQAVPPGLRELRSHPRPLLRPLLTPQLALGHCRLQPRPPVRRVDVQHLLHAHNIRTQVRQNLATASTGIYK